MTDNRRVLALHKSEEVGVFASASPQLTDYLPSTWSTTGNADGGDEVGSLTGTQPQVPRIHLPYTNPLGETVQSVLLLSKVLEHMAQTNMSPAQRQLDVDYLDETLHTHMMRAMSDARRADKTWHQCCYAFFTCIT